MVEVGLEVLTVRKPGQFRILRGEGQIIDPLPVLSPRKVREMGLRWLLLVLRTKLRALLR